MAKNKLTALAVKAAGDGKLFDGDGLSLVKKSERGNWVFRYTFLGRRREMGLGVYPQVSLADARKSRDAASAILAAGHDPISERDAARDAARIQRDRHDPTFEEMTMIVFESRKAGLRDDGARGQWLNPLVLHVFPKIGRKRMSAIHQADIRDALAPIWRKKHPTAIKCIIRIGIVFRAAKLMGIPCEPFSVDAAKHMLGAFTHTTQNIAATRWQDIPALYQSLEGLAVSRLCLRWMMLTLVRSDGCRKAEFDEISGGVWTVPADRVKATKSAAREFRVPLSGQAIEIARICAETSGQFLFPNNSGRGGITDVALHHTLNRIGEAGRPHGFRTSFRTWVQDTNACSYDVAETVLGHTIGGKVERTYARSDMLEQRRIVMDKWASHVTGLTSHVSKAIAKGA